MGVASARFFGRLATFAFLLQISTPAPAQLRPAAIDARPIGTPVSIIIEFGEQYLGSEQYDAKITILDVVRGEKAWELVKQASASTPAPKQGFECLAARVRFEFAARTSLAHYSYDLDPSQFTATDRDGREFAAASLVTPPTPVLKGKLKSGDSLEGWLTFLVPQKVSQPLMVFRENVDDVSHVGSGTWFELYRRSPASAAVKP